VDSGSRGKVLYLQSEIWSTEGIPPLTVTIKMTVTEG